VHRSGRTARAEKEGVSVVIVCPEERASYLKIVRELNQGMLLFSLSLLVADWK
jgi:superfamily II DNA/RNA helicase